MSVRLTLNNFGSTNIKETASLNADVAASATTLTLKNNQNVVADDYLLVGAAGSETGEIVKVASATGATVVVTDPLLFPYQSNTRVTALNGNQIRVYRAPNINNLPPADNTFTLFTGSTVNIDPDQLQTNFIDSTGTTDYWYKITFYNSTTLAETDLAASMCVRGGTIYYCSTDNIREESGIRSPYITEKMVDEKRRAAMSEVDSAASGQYTLPFTTPINAGIQQITTVLAAGYLMTSQYDQFTDLYNNGQAKIDWANIQLDKLKSGQFDIIGADGNSTKKADAVNGFSGYPNATTADDTNGAEDYMFKRDFIDGYGARKY
jgi:hypothetical protein